MCQSCGQKQFQLDVDSERLLISDMVNKWSLENVLNKNVFQWKAHVPFADNNKG